MARPYHFRTPWLVDQPRERLWRTLEVLLEQDDPMPWWGAVTVTARRGEEIDLEARSVFGYRLRFTVYDLRLEPARSMRFRSRGDLAGTACLTFADAEPGRTLLTIDWDVEATPRWMRRLDPALRPVFVLAHAVIMRTGRRRLNRWLASRERPHPR